MATSEISAQKMTKSAATTPNRQSLNLAIASSWLERWSKLAAEQGTRAMDALREGVAEAITALGSGFVAQGANQTLRTRLQSGELSTQAYYQQLRRLVYRLIFLFVAEERDLLLLPDVTPETRRRYDAYYSLRRVRELAGAVRGSPHSDLYCQVRLLFALLREGYAGLGVPGLGSFLFSARATPDLDAAELTNQALLTAIRALSLTVENGVRRPVDYRNLDSEELGSIYESLLELHPAVNLAARTFALTLGAGSERKTTGSHYTPTPLVENLLDTALEPVVAQRLAQADDLWRKGGDRSHAAQQALHVAALLSIKVLDGAAGSGHMLIGAGRRLASHLARIRTGDAEPSPADLRAAMRDVVRHCLYGVDINDMAVELCKVALWMETMEPGKPLSFLDAHIQCGNSLIGVTPGLDIAEIPDDAFQPVTGDDRTTATGLRKRNKKAREGQMAFALGDAAPAGSTERHADKRAAMLAAIEDLAEDGVAQVAAKARSYAEYLQSTEYKWARWEADAWTAAFFWPIPQGDAGVMAAPTQEVLVAVRAGKLKRHETLLREVRRIARTHQFLHWALQFPEVFASEVTSHESGVTSHESGITDDASRMTHDPHLFPRLPGFDVMLMNPPWERIKLQEKEWFAVRSPEIASAPNAAARKRMIAALEDDDPVLWRTFQADVRAAESESHFIRNSGHYPLCGRGDVNTYAVFAELVRQVLSPAGRVGIIVPSGIATDDTTKYYFQDVMETGTLVSLYDFENRQAIFPGVHRSYKFCLLTLCGAVEDRGKPAEFVFFALDMDDLRDKERRFTLTASEITQLNPNSKTAPVFRSRRDADIAKQIYQRVPILQSTDARNREEWHAYYLRLIDYSDHSSFLEPQQSVSSERTTSFDSIDRGKKLPIYESKLFHGYDHRYATYNESGRVEAILGTQKASPWGFPRTKFLFPADAFEQIVSKYDYKSQWFLAVRELTGNTNMRTVIATILPRLPSFRNTTVTIGLDSAQSAVQLLGILNSFIFDYLARQSLSGNHLSFGFLKQLPIPPSEKLKQSCKWCSPDVSPCITLILSDWFQSRALELTYTAWDLQPFARDCGYDGPPFRWDEERRFLLRCELDAAYFHLYGIERDDVDYIMETFSIVKRKDIKAHGEYRTKRVILEMYDAMAAAMQGGAPYGTRLAPPPADPRVAHEA